jgi:hypothetical protein
MLLRKATFFCSQPDANALNEKLSAIFQGMISHKLEPY